MSKWEGNMKIRRIILLALAISGLVVGFGCKKAITGEPKTLLDKTVSVAGGGGGADVSFQALKGQKIKIELKAESSDMQPYGFLHKPDGKEEYRPTVETAKNAMNESKFTADKKGRYNLTLFDGSNNGGKVSVTITAE
jgi:hypothetical protein